MDNYITKLINEGKITPQDSEFLKNIFPYFKTKYSYLNIKEDVWIGLFSVLINQQTKFNELNFKNSVDTYITNYIKSKINNNDINIINSYLNMLLSKNTYDIILKKLKNFLLELNHPLNKEYYNLLKSQCPNFKKILQALGIVDFNYQLFEYYINNYFEIEKSLKTSHDTLDSVIEKYSDLLNYTSIRYEELDNLYIEIKDQFMKNLEFQKIKYIFHNYDLLFSKIFNDCLINKNIPLNDFKNFIYKSSLNSLYTLIEEYQKYSYLKKIGKNDNTFVYSLINKINNCEKNDILTENEIIRKLVLSLVDDEDTDLEIKEKALKRIYNEMKPIYRNYLRLYLINGNFNITNTIGYLEYQKISSKIKVMFPKEKEVNINIYTYILGDDARDITKIKKEDELLELETKEIREQINLFFLNKLEDKKMQNIIKTKINEIKTNYININKIINESQSLKPQNIQELLLKESKNILERNLIIEYILSSYSKEDINNILEYLNSKISDPHLSVTILKNIE